MQEIKKKSKYSLGKTRYEVSYIGEGSTKTHMDIMVLNSGLRGLAVGLKKWLIAG